MRIARKFGMAVITQFGDADAHIALPPATPASITGEYVMERFALYDHALKAQIATGQSINAALRDAAPAPAQRRAE